MTERRRRVRSLLPSIACLAMLVLAFMPVFAKPANAELQACQGGFCKVSGCGEGEIENESDRSCPVNSFGTRAKCCQPPTIAAPAAPTEEAPPADLIAPTLSIPIPTIKFSDARVSTSSETSQQLSLPWIGDYIQGIYDYAVGVAAVLAAVMMMIGGFQYLIAGGDSSAVSAAKKRITDALIGLVLTLGTYTILGTVSGSLLSLPDLSVDIVARELYPDFDEPGGVDVDANTPALPGGTGPSTFDDTFKKYAGCIGIDWRILKAIAYKESHLDPNAENKFGFVGLFQTKQKFCGLSKTSRSAECTAEGLKNPDTNTAAVVNGQLRGGVNTITKICPNIQDAKRFVMLLYFAHNSGGGALRNVLSRAGCNASEQAYVDASVAYYNARAASTGKTIHNQAGRMRYSQAVADKAIELGVTTPFVPAEQPCPL